MLFVKKIINILSGIVNWGLLYTGFIPEFFFFFLATKTDEFCLKAPLQYYNIFCIALGNFPKIVKPSMAKIFNFLFLFTDPLPYVFVRELRPHTRPIQIPRASRTPVFIDRNGCFTQQ